MKLNTRGIEMVKWLWVVGVAGVLTGCVTAGKYNDLEAKNTQTEQQLSTCQTERSELQKKLGTTSSERNQLEGSVANMKKALEEAEARKQETEKRLSEFRELTEKFKELVDAGKLTIKVRNGKMMIALSTDILFTSGSAQLSPAGKLAIREVTELLKDLNNRKFQIEGHTDNMPIHTKHFPSNWELASARAMSVLNTMLEAGFPEDHVSTASYAASEPIADNSTKEGRAENRRIDIVIVPDLSGLPGFDELNRMSGTSVETTQADSIKKSASKGAETETNTSSGAASAANGAQQSSSSVAMSSSSQKTPPELLKTAVSTVSPDATPDSGKKSSPVASSSSSATQP